MSIESNPFGGLRLTGEDAEQFLRQMRYGRPNRAAREIVALGKKLGENARRNGGQVLLHLDPKTGKLVPTEPENGEMSDVRA